MLRIVDEVLKFFIYHAYIYSSEQILLNIGMSKNGESGKSINIKILKISLKLESKRLRA
jgi:hypothetical protein